MPKLKVTCSKWISLRDLRKAAVYRHRARTVTITWRQQRWTNYSGDPLLYHLSQDAPLHGLFRNSRHPIIVGKLGWPLEMWAACISVPRDRRPSSCTWDCEISFLDRTAASATVVADKSLSVFHREDSKINSLLHSVPGFVTRLYRSLPHSLAYGQADQGRRHGGNPEHFSANRSKYV